MKNFLKEFIPPVLLKAKQKLFHKSEDSNPAWHTVESGLLKGINIYVSDRMPAFKEMIAGVYDSFLWDHLQNYSLEGATIIDVGAHIGYHSLGFARMVGNKGKVIAFEPNLFNIERFKKNLSGNENLKDNISIIPIALSNMNKEVRFYFSKNIDDETSSGGYIENSYKPLQDSEYKKAGFISQSIQTKELDRWLEENNCENIQLIKIDAEGAEHLVLSGAIETLKKCSPKLFIEIHSVASMLLVSQILNNLEYHIKMIDEDSISRGFVMAEKADIK